MVEERRHKVLSDGHVQDSTDVRPAIEMEPEQVFFAHFEKCIQNKIILVQRTGKIVKRTNGKCMSVKNNNE